MKKKTKTQFLPFFLFLSDVEDYCPGTDTTFFVNVFVSSLPNVPQSVYHFACGSFYSPLKKFYGIQNQSRDLHAL